MEDTTGHKLAALRSRARKSTFSVFQSETCEVLMKSVLSGPRGSDIWALTGPAECQKSFRVYSSLDKEYTVSNLQSNQNIVDSKNNNCDTFSFKYGQQNSQIRCQDKITVDSDKQSVIDNTNRRCARSEQKYKGTMARVALWAMIVFVTAVFLSYYLDTPVPEAIDETWKVKLIDGSMRTYRHLIDILVALGVTDYFSPLDRMLADWFILAQMTGVPWGMSLTADQLKIKDTLMDGVRVRVYEPVSTYRNDERALLVFLHGGGWSTLSIDSYDPLVRKLARESGAVVVSVSYRQSPEFPFPIPLEDSLKVVNHVVHHAEHLRVDPNRIAVGGDSCGGNMAASIALRMRDRIAMQFLIVPALQFFNFKTTAFIENTRYFHDSINSPSSVIFVTNYLGIPAKYYQEFLQNNHTSRSLKRSHMAERIDQRTWMKRDLVRNKQLLDNLPNNYEHGNEVLSEQIEEIITDPYAAPLMADDRMLRNSPEAYIVTCGYDFIRDDGVMYAERLKSVGSKVTHKHYDSGFHHAWFFPHGPMRIKVAVQIVEDLINALKRL